MEERDPRWRAGPKGQGSRPMGQNGKGTMQAPLSAEEARLASLLAEGRATHEIATAFGIAEQELHTRLSVLQSKLGEAAPQRL